MLSRLRATIENFARELRFLRRGASWRDRAELLRLFFHVHLRLGAVGRLTAGLPTRRRQLELRLEDGTDVRVRNGDGPVLFEVFGNEAYGIDYGPLGNVRSVLDLGANVGLATVFLAARFPTARFCCVEPAEESFTLLEENLKRNGVSAHAIRAAVVPAPGDYRVEPARYPALDRVVPGEGPGSRVEALTVTQILDRAGIDRVDLAKVDIEGNEPELFASAGEWADRVGALVAEIHPPLTTSQAADHLAAFGFAPSPLPARGIFRDILFVARPDRIDGIRPAIAETGRG